MGSLRKTFALIACGTLFLAGCSSVPAKPWWQFSWRAPTLKLPDDIAADPETNAQKSAAKSEQAESPKQSAPLRASTPSQPTTVADRRLENERRDPAARPPAASVKPAVKTLPAEPYQRELAAAREHEQAGRNAAARAIYYRLTAEHPSRPEAYHRWGQLAAREGHYQEAEGLHVQSSVLNPRDPETLNDLGYCLYCQRKFARAEKVMREAVALRPSDRQLHANLGAVYGHLGRESEALEQFRLAGSEADACANLAEILTACNRRDAAKDYLRQALAADPAHARAKRALDALADPGTPSVATRATPAASATR
jgi:Flp pilus assembly protein TadD